MFELGWIGDPRFRAAAELPTGGAQLDAVRALDPAQLSHGDRLIALEMWERCVAVATADKQRLYAALSHGDPDHDRGQVEWVCDEVALVTKLSANTCGSRLLVGRALVEQFPDTLAQIASGQITYWYGRALAVALRVSPTTVAEAWRILGDAGTIETLGRRGTFITGWDPAAHLPSDDGLGEKAELAQDLRLAFPTRRCCPTSAAPSPARPTTSTPGSTSTARRRSSAR